MRKKYQLSGVQQSTTSARHVMPRSRLQRIWTNKSMLRH